MIEKFNSKIHKTESCWLWTGCIGSHGYGVFSVSHEEIHLAHRYAWFLKTGQHPKDKCVCHTCDNKQCVNPDHLWIGTIKDNNLDCKNKGRLNPGRMPGQSNPSAKLTEIQAQLIKTDTRPVKVIAGNYSVSIDTIYNIKNGKNWKHIGVQT
jgi:hypothetical protein